MSRVLEALRVVHDRTPPSVTRALRPALPMYNYAVERLSQPGIEETPYGVTIQTDGANRLEIGLATGTFEPEAIEFFSRLVADEPITFVDVGANIGFYSILCGLEAAPESRVEAFEPLPPIVDRFERNLDLNPAADVLIHDYALADEDGTAHITVPPESNLGTGSIMEKRKSARRVEIETRRLDSVWSPEDSLDLLKIDVEGAERRVVDGAVETLDRHRPDILLELHPMLLDDAERDVAAIRGQLEDAGYESIRQIETGVEQDISALDSFAVDEANRSFVFVH